MCEIESLDVDHWNAPVAAPIRDRALTALERGDIVLLPRLPFLLAEGEDELLSPALVGDSKNIAFDARRGELRGQRTTDDLSTRLQSMLARFAADATALLDRLLPQYHAGQARARTSFRPVEIEGRPTSWRKDDTRLHVDAFPSSPTRGARILRVFSNIDPQGRPRVWRLGEGFDAAADRERAALRGPPPGLAALLAMLRITKGRRSAYDHMMLRLHDAMKADAGYQALPSQRRFDFPAGATWIVFTDQVPHAAIAGQHVLEQTYIVPLACMQDPTKTPLARLERLLERRLA